MIERIVIQNFKSFGWEAATLELQPLNFRVGANATGKSNFLGALRFVRTALLHDVETARACQWSVSFRYFWEVVEGRVGSR